MDQLVLANISLDVFGVILSFIPVVYLINNRRYRLKLNFFFLGVAVSNIFMIIGDLADWAIQDASAPAMRLVLTWFSVLFYVASAFVLYYFARYMDEYLHLSGKMRKIYLTAIIAVCSIQILFAVLSPFTGAIFYITNEGYNRGPLFMISQFVPLFCYISFMILVLANHKKLSRREVIFFLLYVFVPLGGGAAQMFFRGIAVVNIGVALALLFILVNIQFEHELALKRQENELADMRIDMMLSQIQPHFMFNVLTGIRKLCETQPSRAAESIGTFSKFLRTNMETLTDKHPIPFEKELAHTKAYLQLEQMRFGDKLQIVYDIEATYFSIPPLTLQPIAENAVRHGLMKKENGGTLTIRSYEEETAFVITVTDDGVGFSEKPGKPENNAHIGLANVKSRLAALCGGSIQIQSETDKGTTFTILIPKEGKAQ